MEHILELYHQPYDPKRPLVCFDEKSVQLLAHIATPVRLGSMIVLVLLTAGLDVWVIRKGE